MTYVLCIIDMQIGFIASYNPTVLENALIAIKQAILDNAIIVLSHYYGYGETHQIIQDILKDYQYTLSCWANVDDKSKAILSSLQVKPARVKILGVNIEACIYQTIDGFYYQIPDCKIEVIKNACNGVYGYKEIIDSMESSYSDARVSVI